MSDTTSASGVQVLEPRPRMSDQASATGSPNGTYDMQNQDGVLWDSITIAPDGTDAWKISATKEGEEAFSGIAGLVPVPFLHVRFNSETDPQNEFVYASLVDTMDNTDNIVSILTLTYVQHLDVAEPGTQTGVWLGTSSGGQRYPRVKA